MRISDAKLTRPLLITVEGKYENDCDTYSCSTWSELLRAINSEASSWVSHNSGEYVIDALTQCVYEALMSGTNGTLGFIYKGYSYDVVAGSHGIPNV